MPRLTAAERQAFVKSSERYADSRVRAADKNGNGNLTRAEAESLGDLKDTYDLYAQPGRTVKTDQFLEFYKAYARVSARQPGAMPPDLQDNVNHWVSLRSPPPPANASEALVRDVLEDFGLDKTTVAIDWAELDAQLALPGNAVSFESALRQALESFLKDGDDLESPYSLIAEDLMWGHPRAEIEAAVKDFVNRPTAKLRLNARTNPPEHGESVEENWVFSLYIADLSDHGHWAIVDRAGNNATYNYGFN